MKDSGKMERGPLMKYYETCEGGLAREILLRKKRCELDREKAVWPSGEHFLKWFQVMLITQKA